MFENWASSGLCRCCHVKGTFLSLCTLNSQDQMEQNIAEMLRETFGVEILIIPEFVESTYTICDICIKKLQDAATFRQQVAKCEDIFIKWYKKFSTSVPEENENIKSEINEPLNDSEQTDCFEEVLEEKLERPIDIDRRKTKTIQKRAQKHTLSKRLNVECSLCNNKFGSLKHLINHLSINHAGEKYGCSICPDTFESIEDFTKHLATHDKRKCHLCQKVLKRNSYKDHMKIHEKPRFVCDVCGKTFCQVSHLYRHSSVHTGVKPFSCELCNKRFTRKFSLNDHKRRHNGEKPYKCNICDKKFGTLSAKNVHIRIHTGSKPYSCSYCPITFTHIGNLQRHIRTHTGERPYSCKTCGKQFGGLSAVKHHMRTHTGEKPYTCELCNQAFAQKYSLKRHMSIHNGLKLHTCNICNKQIADLKKHLKVVHSGQKPYQCSFCDKRFADRGYLKFHLRTHTGERPFVCNQCGRGFTQAHVLKNHRCGYVTKSAGTKKG